VEVRFVVLECIGENQPQVSNELAELGVSGRITIDSIRYLGDGRDGAIKLVLDGR